MAQCHNIMVLEFQGQGEFFELEIQRHGGTYDWNLESMGGIFRGDRQECEHTNQVTTQLTTMKSKMQDKH